MGDYDDCKYTGEKEYIEYKNHDLSDLREIVYILLNEFMNEV